MSDEDSPLSPEASMIRSLKIHVANDRVCKTETPQSPDVEMESDVEKEDGEDSEDEVQVSNVVRKNLFFLAKKDKTSSPLPLENTASTSLDAAVLQICLKVYMYSLPSIPAMAFQSE